MKNFIILLLAFIITIGAIFTLFLYNAPEWYKTPSEILIFFILTIVISFIFSGINSLIIRLYSKKISDKMKWIILLIHFIITIIILFPLIFIFMGEVFR